MRDSDTDQRAVGFLLGLIDAAPPDGSGGGSARRHRARTDAGPRRSS
ncbi:hypothetical protein ACFYZ8_41435 [Streptomyces sp. NPDC001668]